MRFCCVSGSAGVLARLRRTPVVLGPRKERLLRNSRATAGRYDPRNRRDGYKWHSSRVENKLTAICDMSSDSHFSGPPAVSPDDAASAVLAAVVTDAAGVERSAADDRSYRALVLDNGLKVVLVHDATTPKAAAAMQVEVGQFSDPSKAAGDVADLPGLAHFLEHMLFLGTEKYPDENEYSRYLSSHAGGSNAYTAAEATMYHFDVAAPALEGALDRFAQFFVAPLFTAEATERELNAVDSENSKNLQNDMWRLFQLDKSTADPRHPYQRFGTGNLSTLRDVPASEGVDVREALLAFHKRYYSASVMTLAVIGAQSLDELHAMVEARFASIPSTDAAPPVFDSPLMPYAEAQMSKRLKAVPVADRRRIEIAWALPEQRSCYLSKPTRLLSHLIGHEGPGSVLSVLKMMNFATGLSAGVMHDNSGFAIFAVNIEVTEQGLDAADDVIAVVFAYIAMLRRSGVGSEATRWIFDEFAAIEAQQFRFQSKQPPQSFVTQLASNLARFPREHVISGPYLPRKFDGDAVRAALDLMTPARVRVLQTSLSYSGTTSETERWYGTPFTAEDVPTEILEKWEHATDDRLALPQPNPFVATDFTIRADVHSPGGGASGGGLGVGPLAAGAGAIGFADSLLELADLPAVPTGGDEPSPPGVVPSLLRDDETARVWFYQDRRFKEPKLWVKCAVRSPSVATSVRHHVMTDLYSRLVVEALNEFAYYAEIAGLEYSVSIATRGLQLSFGGFSDKLGELAVRVSQVMASVSFDDDTFTRIRDKATRDLKNFLLEQPYQHALYTMNHATSTPRFHVKHKLAELEDISAADCRAFCAPDGPLLRGLFFEALVYGNATETEGRSVTESIIAPLRAHPGCRALHVAEVPVSRAVLLPDVELEWVIDQDGENDQDGNSAIECFYQIGIYDPASSVALAVLAHVLKEPFFDTLRTKEQLGYLVFSGVREQHGVEGLRLLLQSSTTDPSSLDTRVEAFLANFGARLRALPEDEFSRNVSAVRTELSKPDKTPRSECKRLWSEIADASYNFRRNASELRALDRLRLEDVVAMFDNYVARAGPQRRKLQTCVWAAVGPASAAQAASASEGDAVDVVVAGMSGSLPIHSGASAAAVAGRPTRRPRLTQWEGVALARSAASTITRAVLCDDAISKVRARIGEGSLATQVAVSDVESWRLSMPLAPIPGLEGVRICELASSRL